MLAVEDVGRIIKPALTLHGQTPFGAVGAGPGRGAASSNSSTTTEGQLLTGLRLADYPDADREPIFPWHPGGGPGGEGRRPIIPLGGQGRGARGGIIPVGGVMANAGGGSAGIALRSSPAELPLSPPRVWQFDQGRKSGVSE